VAAKVTVASITSRANQRVGAYIAPRSNSTEGLVRMASKIRQVGRSEDHHTNSTECDLEGKLLLDWTWSHSFVSFANS
jgi:hypothetical protein